MSSAASTAAKLEGVTFDHYQVLTRSDGSLHELGRGAMGITYRAFDTNLQVPVALKVINTQRLNTEASRQQFVREARSAAKLRNPHVASVFHLGMDGETYFYAMEYIAGETVESLVKRRGPLPPFIVLRVAVQVARALHAADGHGLVHRDIKPANLMLVSAEDELCVKVIDFGLAKSLHDAEQNSPDRADISANAFVGTPHYASPEQLESKPVDIRSDIYSLGATLWYMLTGHPPFSGSVAQVMSQHLTALPPVADLRETPPSIVALLQRMLAKTPAGRPATAGDLRRETEKVLEEFTGHAGVGAAARLAQEEQLIASQAAPSDAQGPQVDFATRTMVGGHLEVANRLGETNDGWIFKARDLEHQRDVRLLLLREDFSTAPEAFTQLEHEVERLANISHANLLQIYGLELMDASAIIAMEWTQGVTLRELLRVRSEISAPEALLVLTQIASGVDHATSQDLQRLDLALHQIFLHFPGGIEEIEVLLRNSIASWPPFVVKLNPLNLTGDVSLSDTWTGAQTMLGSGDAAASKLAGAAGGAPQYTREAAVLIYELMGGALKSVVAAGAGGTARYTPLSNLTEEGNEVLRRAMDPERSFPKAADFLRALLGVSQLETRQREIGSSVKPSALSHFGPGTNSAVPEISKLPLVLTAAAVAVLLVGGAWFYLRPGPASTPVSPGSLTDSPTTPEHPIEPPPVTPSATPVPEPPAPDSRAMLKAAVVTADKVEDEGDFQAALNGWLGVIKTYPEAEIGRMRTELLLDKKRLHQTKLTPEELEKYGPSLRDAAALEVVSAMLLLGESLREQDPEESFRWFSLAAAKGVPSALTQKGLMYTNGAGTPVDLAAAVDCFDKAATKGDPAAKFALAECLLGGKGIAADLPRALDLLRQASAAGNLRAMNKLATCYQQGIGGPTNFSEAFRLFSAAAEQGFGDALGNLGVMYINGDGVAHDPRKAVELFQKGAGDGDAYCMYLYARCLESGTGLPAANPVQAKSWYKRSAELGFPKAIAWCQKNHVEFIPPKTARR